MMPEAILQAKLDLLERQRRASVLLVVPGDRAVMNADPSLSQ